LECFPGHSGEAFGVPCDSGVDSSDLWILPYCHEKAPNIDGILARGSTRAAVKDVFDKLKLSLCDIYLVRWSEFGQFLQSSLLFLFH
jgi:hypothetical protein